MRTVSDDLTPIKNQKESTNARAGEDPARG